SGAGAGGVCLPQPMIREPTAALGNRSAAPMPERGLCAHRGATQLSPENTLAAFRDAILVGAHMIELDLRLSQDGHPMVIHDQSVERTTDGTGDVSDLTLAQIKQFTVRNPRATSPVPERIPTLEETLDIMPRNAWLNLHLKGKVEKPGWPSRLLRPFLRRGAR